VLIGHFSGLSRDFGPGDMVTVDAGWF
jgi:hypothetical protein